MTKQELRLIFREKRGKISPHELAKMNDLILVNFQRIQLPYLRFVHTYLASPKLKEPATDLIIRYLQFKNPALEVLVPKIDQATGSMVHIPINGKVEWEQNSFGIVEPKEGNPIEAKMIDLVLIPLLAFDVNGARVGFGKGYYDRFLGECRKDVLKIGISLFGPSSIIEDINEYDVPLTAAVTPEQVHYF